MENKPLQIKKICGKDVLYYCISDVWNQCIPYEGNEHLLGTTDTPDRYNLDKNTLFGVKLKPGYVLELEDDEVGILFPTANGFAISYVKGCWQSLDDIKKTLLSKYLGLQRMDLSEVVNFFGKGRIQKQFSLKLKLLKN